jgi:ABC-type sugar transport system permease subunit
MFFYIVLPHLKRAITVVVMIETIFLLSVFAEIFTTTAGGPGTATTNLTFLIYAIGLQQFDVGIASAGGIFAVVLANIVSFFLVRMLARNLKESTKNERSKSPCGWRCWAGPAPSCCSSPSSGWRSPPSRPRQAYTPSLVFLPTLDTFREVFSRSNYLAYVQNSLIVSLGSTVLSLLLAVPAAYSMAFFPTGRTQKLLLWMLSTKMMPAVGVLIPIYLLAKNTGCSIRSAG